MTRERGTVTSVDSSRKEALKNLLPSTLPNVQSSIFSFDKVVKQLDLNVSEGYILRQTPRWPPLPTVTRVDPQLYTLTLTGCSSV